MNGTDLIEYASYTVVFGFACGFAWNFLFWAWFVFLDFFEERD